MNHQSPTAPGGDEEILDLYFARDERAIEETERRWGRSCMQVSMGILHSHPDAEECVNDTYLKTWNSVPPARPRSLGAYVLRIVRNLSINRLRNLTAARRSRDLTVSLEELSACVPAPTDGAAPGGTVDELPRYLSDFLHRTEETDRRLFVGRYWYARTVKDLAETYGLSEKQVYKRLERTRDRLRAYLTERGYSV